MWNPSKCRNLLRIRRVRLQRGELVEKSDSAGDARAVFELQKVDRGNNPTSEVCKATDKSPDHSTQDKHYRWHGIIGHGVGAVAVLGGVILGSAAYIFSDFIDDWLVERNGKNLTVCFPQQDQLLLNNHLVVRVRHVRGLAERGEREKRSTFYRD